MVERAPFNPRKTEGSGMAWYYAEGGEQRGPVSDEDFQRLVANGTVHAATLVWQEGMPEWKHYGEIAGRPSALGSVACSECGRVFPVEDMIELSGAAVCPGCKPIALQRLKAGVTRPGRLVLAEFWRRALAEVIDYVIVQIPPVFLFFFAIMSAAKGDPNAVTEEFAVGLQLGVSCFSLVVWGCYETVLLGWKGQTLGKMALGIKVVTSSGEKLTYGRAAGRWGGKFLSRLVCCIGYLVAGFDEELRALHDHICDTRVVLK